MKNLKKIPLFFSLLIIKLLVIVFSIVVFYKIDFFDLINSKNIPQNITTIYLILFYISIISSLYLSDKNGFKEFLKEPNKSIKFITAWLLGFITISCFFGFELLSNLINISNLATFDVFYLLKIFSLSFLVGFIEELLFRNFIFNNLKKDLNVKTSYAISAYIYAQLHFLNLSLALKEIILPLIGLFILGLIFNALYEKKGLSFSIGFHTSFIFVMSFITQKNLFNINTEDLYLSGGYNPLSGILGIVFLSIIFVLINISFYKKNVINQ